MAFADAGQRVLLAAEGAVFTDEGKVDMAVCGWDAAEIEAELFF
jgi:alkylated DNA nucleotide flippase Atl1